MLKKLPLLPLLALLFFAVSCQKDLVKNMVPVADAGNADTVYTTSTTLSGTGTDSDGTIVAYLWSQVAGPNPATIANPGAATPLVKDLKKGKYTFQLMVTDNDGATGVDTVNITVDIAESNTLTLQPVNNPTEMTVYIVNNQDQTHHSDRDFSAAAWTKNGDPVTSRGLLKFDLSSIPSTATIKKATLSLYSDPTPILGNLIDANFGTDNSFYIYQVADNWSASTLTWANQPNGKTSNAIVLPSTTQSFLDLNIDVTGMVASMVNTNANYGFKIQLVNEVIYTSRIFVASTHPNYQAKYPKLVVEYE